MFGRKSVSRANADKLSVKDGAIGIMVILFLISLIFALPAIDQNPNEFHATTWDGQPAVGRLSADGGQYCFYHGSYNPETEFTVARSRIGCFPPGEALHLH